MECFSHFLINGVFESLYKSTYSDPKFPQYFHLNRFQRILASSPTCIMHIFLLVNQSGSSVTQLHLTLCDPEDCSTPGFPVHHQLPELVQIHVHRDGDAIQPSHPLLSPSPPAFNLFQWVCSSHQVAKVLEFQLQHLFFQWIFRTDFL